MSAPSPGRPQTARLSSGGITEVEFAWPASERTKFIEAAALAALLPRVEYTTVYTVEIRRLEKQTSSTDTGWRKLPGRAERMLAETVAFVAGAEGGFCEAAVGVEEGAEEVVLRLSMTEGVPERVCEGVEGVLEAVTMEGSERETRSVVLQRILSLHTSTIAEAVRCRWHHGLARMFVETMAGNNEFGSLVSVDTGSENSTDMGSAEDILETLYQRFQSVFTLAEQGAECKAEVRTLVETCFRARKSRLFKTFMNLQSRMVLWSMIETFAQYKTAAHTLVSLVRLHPTALHTLTLRTLGTPLREALPPPESSDSGLTKLAASLVDTPVDDASAKVQMLTGLSPETLLSKYEELYLSRLTIHAEMQLVKFYEENPGVTTPVFMGTSQPSCYLCARFLSSYGSLAISKSCHTVYPRWTLPRMACRSQHAVDTLTKIVDEMASDVEEGCRVVLAHDDYREVVRSGASASGTATPRLGGAASSINMSQRSSRNPSPARSEREERQEVASSSRASTRARGRESRPQSVLESAVYRAVSELKPEEVVARRKSERARSRDGDYAPSSTVSELKPEDVLRVSTRKSDQRARSRDGDSALSTTASELKPEDVLRVSRRKNERARSRDGDYALSTTASELKPEDVLRVSRRKKNERARSRDDDYAPSTTLSELMPEEVVSRRKSERARSRDSSFAPSTTREAPEPVTVISTREHDVVRDASPAPETVLSAPRVRSPNIKEGSVIMAAESAVSRKSRRKKSQSRSRSRSRSRSHARSERPQSVRDAPASTVSKRSMRVDHEEVRESSATRAESRRHERREERAAAILSDGGNESAVSRKSRKKSSGNHEERSRDRSHHQEERRDRESSRHYDDIASTVLSARDTESRQSRHQSSQHHKERSRSRTRSRSRHHEETRDRESSRHYDDMAPTVLSARDTEFRQSRKESSTNHEERTQDMSHRHESSQHYEDIAQTAFSARDTESRQSRKESSTNHEERSRDRSHHQEERRDQESSRHYEDIAPTVLSARDTESRESSRNHEERSRDMPHHHEERRGQESSLHYEDIAPTALSARDTESRQSKKESSRNHEERSRDMSHHHEERRYQESSQHYEDIAPTVLSARDTESRQSRHNNSHHRKERSHSRTRSKSRHHEEQAASTAVAAAAVLSDRDNESVVFKKLRHKSSRHHKERSRSKSRSRSRSRLHKERASKTSHYREEKASKTSHYHEEKARESSHHHEERAGAVLSDRNNESRKLRHKSSRRRKEQSRSRSRSISKSRHHDRKVSTTSHEETAGGASIARSSTRARDGSSRPQSVREASVPPESAVSRHKSTLHHEEHTTRGQALLTDWGNESAAHEHKSSSHHEKKDSENSHHRHHHHHEEKVRESSVARTSSQARHHEEKARESSIARTSSQARHHEEKARESSVARTSSRARESSVARTSSRARDRSSRPQSVRESSVPPRPESTMSRKSRHKSERDASTKEESRTSRHNSERNASVRDESVARSTRSKHRSSRPESVREESIPRSTRSKHRSSHAYAESVREESVAGSTRSKHRSSRPQSVRDESLTRSVVSTKETSRSLSAQDNEIAVAESIATTSGRTKERTTTRPPPILRTGTMPSVPEVSDNEDITYGSVVSSSNPRKALVAAIYSQLSPRHKRPSASRVSTVDGGVPLVTTAKERSGSTLERSAVIENSDQTLETSSRAVEQSAVIENSKQTVETSGRAVEQFAVIGNSKQTVETSGRTLEAHDAALRVPTAAEAQKRERVRAHSIASSATSLGLFRSESRDSAITAPASAITAPASAITAPASATTALTYSKSQLRSPVLLSTHEIPMSPPHRTITTNPSAFLPAPLSPPQMTLVPPPASARRTPLRGPLELTIERNTPTLADTLNKMRGATPQPEYTIYLAGHYAEGLDVGDQMFSGKVTTRESKSRRVQCKGFQIRSSLRQKKGTESEHPRGKDVGPLSVQEITKGDELTVLDISFTDAVVRLEVFWDV